MGKELHKAEKDMLECVQKLKQLEKLDIPIEIIEGFKKINRDMSDFVDTLFTNKKGLENAQETFNENLELLTKSNKKIQGASGQEDQ